MTHLPFVRCDFELAGLAWRFGCVAQRPWDAAAPAGAAYDLHEVQEWLPAEAPGDVHSDLLAAGRIADPYRGDGLAACRWVEGVDWWYRIRLPLGLQPGQRALLEFDGIDYLSAVYVEGRELARHAGMWGRQVIKVPPDLASRAEVELAVRIWGSDALPRYAQRLWERAWGRLAGAAQGTFRPFDDRLATLKTPMHSGWDFAPRLRAMGIWDDVRLLVCGGVYVQDIHVQAEPLRTAAAGLALPAGKVPAVVRLHLALDSDVARSAVAHVVVRPASDGVEESGRCEFPLRLPAGRSEHRLAFHLPAVRLWQPWERGEPALYQLEVALVGADRPWPDGSPPPAGPAVLDAKLTRFGVRRVELQRTDQGHPWLAVVNGQPLFLRGANWTPQDALAGRIRTERYAALLRQARATGVNFLRVWGGGGRQRRAFYDLCDELGLLVWQEFPIACVFLDHLPRQPAYQVLLRAEAAGMVRALRNHPSLFLWCGGNEWSPSRNRRAVAVLADAVATEDGARPFVPASPGLGDAHHWRVWHGLAPLHAYRNEQASMVSEFGLQGAPDADSLRAVLDHLERWPPGPGWQRHNAELAKLARYARWFESLRDGRDPLESFVAASQRAQAAGVQILIEHVRRRKGVTGGLAVWQWNEPWPSICWSVIDYFGRPKLALATLQRVMQPLLISLDYPLRPYRPGDLLEGMVWVVNDGLAALDGCWLRVSLEGGEGEVGRGGAGKEGEVVALFELPCGVPANAAQPLSKLALRLPAGFSRLHLDLRRGNSLLAQNVYDLRFHDGGPDPAGQALRRRIVDLILR